VLIGLTTGTFLYFSNVTIVSVLNLLPTPSELKTSPKGSVVRGEIRRQKQRVMSAHDPLGMPASDITTAAPSTPHPRIDSALKREYADWLDKDRGRHRGGLLSTTIIEEDDSSEGF
jgi:hypothetical protein